MEDEIWNSTTQFFSPQVQYLWAFDLSWNWWLRCLLGRKERRENPRHLLSRGPAVFGRNTQHTTHNKREERKKERQICSDLVALNLPGSSCWLKDQTCLDWHQTWWARSALRVIRFGQLVWVLVQWSIRFERCFVSSGCCSSEQSSHGRWRIWVVNGVGLSWNLVSS
jgi:hypothetical protein